MATMTFALGCASTPPESPEQAQADAATADRVYAALQADRLHFYIGLEVRVRYGAPYIGGLTFDASVRDEATEIARNVPGVIKGCERDRGKCRIRILMEMRNES
jgi:osmotically-inducible protein OsmY